MIETILKRDGREVPFDASKITYAIERALEATGGKPSEDSAEKLAEQVVCELEAGESVGVPTVEEIQDTVEKVLIKNGFVRTAKSYILYRAERSRVREMNTRLMKIYDDITFKPAVDSDVKRENANINGDTAMGAMLKYGSEGAKQFNEMFVLKPEHAQAHREGDIHIHDMDFLTLTTTCCQIDLIKLFKGGFSTGHGVLREPNDIQSYSALACIAIQANQNDQHGGQSVFNFDYSMAEGVKKTFARRYRDNMARGLELLCDVENADDAAKDMAEAILKEAGVKPTLVQNETYRAAEAQKLAGMGIEEERIQHLQNFAHEKAVKETNRATYQAMEALIHNLNTMNSRAGAQVPFSSINYGMDTSPEGRMVMKNLLLATEAGLGNGETPIFPIQIFRVKEGVNFNEGEPNYDLFKLACRVSAKRLFPNFSFQDAPFNLQYYKEGHPETEISYMGCRTRVMANYACPDKEVSTGRGNLSFTSINLPRIAIKVNHNVDMFFSELDRMIDLVVAQLFERFEIQAAKKVRNYPFLMGQGVWIGSEKLDIDDEVGEVLKNGTLSVGFIGLAEALVALTGKHHGQSPEARNLGLEIVGFMRDYLDRLSQEKQLNFTLLATPAEGLSGRFVRLDEVTAGSRMVDRTLKNWLAGMTPQEREHFIDTVYEMLSAGDAHKTAELMLPRNVLASLRAFGAAAPADRRMLRDTLRLLLHAAMDALKDV